MLLDALPHQEHERLLPKLERVPVESRQTLIWPGEPIPYVYFPTTAVVSLLSLAEDGAAVELALVGAEGVVGLPVFLGAETVPYQAICQIAGEAWRMRAAALREEADTSQLLRALLLRYTHACLVMVMQVALCNHAHPVRQRAARWLLMLHDRAGAGHLQVTHESMSEMLGLRRATITRVMRGLREAGLIGYQRGLVTILDRPRLEATACECYRIIRYECERATRSHQRFRAGFVPSALN